MSRSLKSWGAIRLVRLVAGIGIGFYALYSADYVFLLPAVAFLLQAALNLTCGGSGCPTANSQKRVYGDVIKPYQSGNRR